MSDTYVLPPVKKGSSIKLLHFPTRMQAFIFRNWELVPSSKIAQVLRVTEDVVCKLAYDMGLPPQGDVSVWMKRGYITVIKQNWHLLSYEQLLQLLGWDEEKLAFILKEDDFLSIKLGDFKFDNAPLYYEPLTESQKAETKEIAETLKEIWKNPERKPFDFFKSNEKKQTQNSNAKGIHITDEWGIADRSGFERAGLFASRFCEDVEKDYNLNLSGNKYYIYLEKGDIDEKPESHRIVVENGSITVSAIDEVGILRGLTWIYDKMSANGGPVVPEGTYTRIPRFNTRMIYSYHGLYGSVFDEDIEISYSDEMLREYARLGVNGIWAQVVLYKLIEFPYDKSMSEGYEKRQENIRRLIKKAADYGIKVYLYLNEPRAMPLTFFEKYPHLKGVTIGDYAAMCTSVPEVHQYLSDAVSGLCRQVPGLGGFFTITMSENLTNCWSRIFESENTCPVCEKRKPHDVMAEINTTIYNAISSVDPNMRMLVWTWGWNRADGFNDDECIKNLPDGVSVMNVSEESMPYDIAGAKGTVLDYTMSLIAPGDRAKHIWSAAKKYGKNTAAKVQINDTWECSTVPYIPVFGLVKGHIERLMSLGVDDLMLSWTLGGAPSPNIKITSQYFFFEEEGITDMLPSLYGEYAETVRQATSMFDEAFREFPFSLDTIYYGPQFSGPANLLFSKNSGETATMTGYPYDDVKTWCGPYTPESLENQFGLLSEGWKKGLDILNEMPECEFKDVATACYDIFRSTYNQIKYVRLRENNQIAQMLDVLKEEEELAISLYEITLRQPMVGYEAANHYVYTPQMCLEKVLNCRRLKKEF